MPKVKSSDQQKSWLQKTVEQYGESLAKTFADIEMFAGAENLARDTMNMQANTIIASGKFGYPKIDPPPIMMKIEVGIHAAAGLKIGQRVTGIAGVDGAVVLDIVGGTITLAASTKTNLSSEIGPEAYGVLSDIRDRFERGDKITGEDWRNFDQARWSDVAASVGIRRCVCG